jgi:hypothetical protein
VEQQVYFIAFTDSFNFSSIKILGINVKIRIKAGMDDDMKAINLEIPKNLESKMNFFYSPYNKQKNHDLYMKFQEKPIAKKLGNLYL